MINLTYEELLIEADSNNLITKEKPLPISKGRIKGNRIAIQRGLSETEKACILAEELGHYYTSTGNILDLSSVSNRKQEFRARMWAYKKMIPVETIVGALRYGCRSRYEIAEFLEVTEQFLEDAINKYKEKYGYQFIRVGNCFIRFAPTLDFGFLDNFDTERGR